MPYPGMRSGANQTQEPMESYYWIPTGMILIADLTIRIGLSIRVIMRKRAASVTLAWLVVILLLPFVGAFIYLLFGENRLGEHRAVRAAADLEVITRWADSLRRRTRVDWEKINPECQPLHRQIDAIIGIPTMPDNRLDLITSPADFFRRLIADIDSAVSSCFLEFYIWNEGGMADQVTEALIRARSRGVTCRILLDSIGSKEFFSSPTCRRMRNHGIEIVEALPAGLVRALFVRVDLRNHRKIVTIDGRIGYSGSQNLVDPRYFKQDEGVGQWIDTMVRVEGPVVEIMTASFIYDWLLETGKSMEELTASPEIHEVPPNGNALVQLVPSGPGYGEDTIHNLLLTTIYAARRELILTTPYFVPDNAILAALKSAAQRGVEVIIILPEKNDSLLVQYASRAHFDQLIEAGVKIMAFSGGLLHAKTITVDRDFSLIGSVNLDMRSFWLNFEMTLFVYDKEFTVRLCDIQHGYLRQARQIRHAELSHRSAGRRFLENCALLVGPLL